MMNGPYNFEYRLTRGEIVGAFFAGLKESPALRAQALRLLLLVGVCMLVLRVVRSGGFHGSDLLAAVLWTVGVAVFLPLWIFLRGKTSNRRLEVSSERIYTEIGTMKAEIPWSTIAVVLPTDSHVIIGRKNGNTFTVPNRVFASPEERAGFIDFVGRHAKATAP